MNWIPCSERMPTEEGRYAIVYRYKGRGHPKAFIGDFFEGQFSVALDKGRGHPKAFIGDFFEGQFSVALDDTEITHWLPLPECPSEDSSHG